MAFIAGLFRTIVGLIFGAASALALSPAAGAFGENSQAVAWIGFGAIAIGGLLGLFAPTIRRAFGRGFLVLGASVFILPISALLLSGRIVGEMTSSAAANDQAATALGAGLAGAAFTGVASFFGLILGTIFLLIGLVLVLGGRREVTVRY